jgi:dihydroflavonol-4-reductase
MRIFITGGSGFIGKHLLRKLTGSGHELYCLVRKPNALEAFHAGGVKEFTGDLLDCDSLEKGMRGCDSIINLANLYSFWEPDKRNYARVNIDGTRNVMETALKLGIAKVIHVSSVVVYGKPADCPFTEESTAGPVMFSEYARTKYEGDILAWKLYKEQKLPLVVVYPSAVVGAGDTKATAQYINAITNRTMPVASLTGSVLTFVHVRDVAEAIVKALGKSGNIGEKYFVGKFQLSMGEINTMISEITGVHLPRLALPDGMVKMNAFLLTGIAAVIKKPPLWGLSVDQYRTMKAGFRCDGSKAERELGLAYTPIRTALEEFIHNKEV